MKKFTLPLLFLLCMNASAQKEANNWYFGNGAGIQFQEDGSVIALTGSSMNTTEGCSAISDANGNLLFYTDGRKIWDKNHIQMIGLGSNYIMTGDPSSTQSGIIVPKLDEPNLYFVFTVDEPHHQNAGAYPNQFTGPYEDGNTVPEDDDGYNLGFGFNIIDVSITGNNGSEGDFPVNGTGFSADTYNPNNPIENSYRCSEKVTAVQKADGTGYWIITHFIDKFYAFMTGDPTVPYPGFNPLPITSQVAPVVPLSGYRRNAIGCIKASPDGTKLAIAHMQRGTVTGGSAENGTVYLYDFNTTTGIVSNPVEISNNTSPYGIEFSPSGKKLYVSYENNSAGFGGVHQYDLESADIPGSDIFISATPQAATLQLGPNGKIYRAVVSTQFLDVINNPEETGAACNYQTHGVTLAPGTTCLFGLPPFITSFFSASITATNTCHGSATQFELNAITNFDTISWNFGDGSPASTAISPVHTYVNAGNYNVVATVTRQADVFTFSQNISIDTAPVANTTAMAPLCDPENDTREVFILSQNNAAIIGTQNPADFEVLYFASQANADAGSSPLPSAGYYNTSNPQTIYARIQYKNNTSCYATTSFEISTLPTPNIITEDKGLVCNNTKDYITITAGSNSTAYTYSWYNGATTPLIRVNTPGVYTVTVTHSNGCSKVRTITVEASDIAIINSVDIVDLTGNNTVTINAIPTGNVDTTYLYSLDKPNGPWQQSNYFEHVSSGMHTVYVYDVNGCGIVERDISILEIPKFFTPNGDGTNDYWDIIGMNPLFYQNSTIQIFDRYGKFLSSIDPRGKGWDGTYNGRPLPSTDYWYVIRLEDGRIVKGHFAMVR